MLVAVLVRRLREGATYADFRSAWAPEGEERGIYQALSRQLGIAARVTTARRVDDAREVLTMGFIDLPVEQLDEALQQLAATAAARHSRIDEIIESTSVSGIYEVIAQDDLGAD